MKNKKNLLQKTSNITGMICFLLSILSVIALYFKAQELGMQHPVAGSFLASSLFFSFIGFVFMFIGNANIPSFKVNEKIDTREK